MNKGLLYGGGYQVVNLVLLLVQAIFLPRYLGLEMYGGGLFLILPILLLGGLWEPVVQRYCIAGDGISRNWWLFGVVFVLFFYSLYLFFLLGPSGEWGVFFLGIFFLLEYMLAIYFIARFQALKEYAKIFLLSFLGLLLCSVVFFLDRSSWLICVFYAIYFVPVVLCGIVNFKLNLVSFSDSVTAVGDVLDAISTRFFYVLINNFSVVLVGFLEGPSKAAILKIVISLSSSFRFCSPLSIGHFFSVVHDASWNKRLRLSMLPLGFFFIGVLLVWLLLPWVEDYGVFFLGSNYEVVYDFFSSILLGVPFYLWSPYLTIVFFRAIGWLRISLICLFSLVFSSIFLYFESVSLFFVSSCIVYCLFILTCGAITRRT